jgi:hypothetical protein
MDYSAVKGVGVTAFLRKARAQSGFKKGMRRMECDQNLGFVHSELTSIGILKPVPHLP